ncbi:MAG TPA: ABC transporter ATP-binding protein [Candidatus Poseidoniales archaeon]|nr:ABC transporter ATP-binding protein [Candidatus Poseidoniales archaeon]
MFLMLWMPLSALLGMVVISTLLALPVIMALDYLKLDPAHTQQVISILEAVRIPNPIAVVNMYPHELSGGMRQRVMIAMMMSCEPKLLIADEPTTALDVTIQAQILQLMRDLRDEKGTAILLITHDLGVIAEMCDSVTVMYAGSIVEKGSIEAILSRPRMPYTIGLLHSIPTIDDESEHRDVLPIIPGQVPDPNLHFDGCRFHPRCPFADELCISTPPPMIEVEPGHFAACHHTNRTENVADVQGSFDVFAAEYVLKGVA